MSKVLVDRELLDSAATWLEVHAPGGGCVEGSVAEDLRAILEQPAEAEGERGEALTPLRLAILQLNGWAKVAAEDGREHTAENYRRVIAALRTAEAQHRAALSAVTAERDGLVAARTAYASEFAPDKNGDPDVGSVHANIRALKAERDQLRAELEMLRDNNRKAAISDAAMSAKEA